MLKSFFRRRPMEEVIGTLEWTKSQMSPEKTAERKLAELSKLEYKARKAMAQARKAEAQARIKAAKTGYIEKEEPTLQGRLQKVRRVAAPLSVKSNTLHLYTGSSHLKDTLRPNVSGLRDLTNPSAKNKW